MQILGSFGMNGAQGLAFSCVAPFKETVKKQQRCLIYHKNKRRTAHSPQVMTRWWRLDSSPPLWSWMVLTVGSATKLCLFGTEPGNTQMQPKPWSTPEPQPIRKGPFPPKELITPLLERAHHAGLPNETPELHQYVIQWEFQSKSLMNTVDGLSLFPTCDTIIINNFPLSLQPYFLPIWGITSAKSASSSWTFVLSSSSEVTRSGHPVIRSSTFSTQTPRSPPPWRSSLCGVLPKRLDAPRNKTNWQNEFGLCLLVAGTPQCYQSNMLYFTYILPVTLYHISYYIRLIE